MAHKKASLFALFMLITTVLAAQEWWASKPYATWSKEEVEKMLTDSPWGQEVRKSLPRITYINPGTAGIERAYDRLRFHIGLLTSKPIRMALARRAMLLDPVKNARTDWGSFVDQEDARNIVVIVNVSAIPADSRLAVVVSEFMAHSKTSDLVSRVSLAADGGKKVRLAEYDPLGENGYGYKFIFPRSLPDGKPLVEPGTKELKFDLIISIAEEQTSITSIPVNKKWDLRKMQYQGRLTF